MPPGTPESGALRERFSRWLRDRRLPLTRQRAAVADLVLEARDHPSVESLRRELQRRGERVGLATLYRTLDLLREAGCVASRDFGDGRQRFEPVRDGDHAHLVCRRCGKVAEFGNERLDRMLQLVADEHGFLLEQHQVTLHGRCAECRRREVGVAAAGRRR